MKNIFILLFSFISSILSAQDWPNLRHYKEANQKLDIPFKEGHRVVFMGNSITEHWRSAFFENNTAYVNRGISGQTTPQMLLRFRQDVIDLKPATVVILAGINDIAQNTGPITISEIEHNIIMMSELAKAHNINVILCSVVPANDFPWRPEIKPADKVIELNTLLKSYADTNNITYVDYYTPMVNTHKGLKKELGADAVHPNDKGYLVMEPIIEAAIRTTLNTPNLPDPLEAGWNTKKVCTVLKEDNDQRILKCIFPPNTGHEKHYHAPHFGYTLKGGTFRITDAKGTKDITIKDGTTWNTKSTSIHEVFNIGKTASSYLIIENKRL